MSFSYATAPVVSNATMTQRTDGSLNVDIYYNLADAENDACNISIILSGDGGSTYTIVPALPNLSGAIGSGITPGTGKHIIWNIGNESYSFNSNQYRVKVIAEDGFVLVAGGTFYNGKSNVI